jgi:hypothetical protein
MKGAVVSVLSGVQPTAAFEKGRIVGTFHRLLRNAEGSQIFAIGLIQKIDQIPGCGVGEGRAASSESKGFLLLGLGRGAKDDGCKAHGQNVENVTSRMLHSSSIEMRLLQPPKSSSGVASLFLRDGKKRNISAVLRAP